MQTSMLTRSVFFLLISFLFCYSVQGAPQIIAPYPNNLYVLENEKAEVTCIVEDTVSNPDQIVFVRRTRFGDINPIRDEGPSGRRYYQNETLGGGSKLRVTLHINQIQFQDDSRNGRYECYGYSGGSKAPFVFAVTVIGLNELPSIEVSDNVTAKLGDQIVLSCNFTLSQAAFDTKLMKMMWTKDGRLIEEVLYPKQQPLKSLKINVERLDVGGIYTCQLISKIRNVREYNVTDNIYVTVLKPTEAVHVTRKTTPITESLGTLLVTSSTEYSTTPNVTASSPVSSVGKASLVLPITLLGFTLDWLLHG